MLKNYISIGYILDNFRGVEYHGRNTFIDFLKERVPYVEISLIGEIGDSWCEGSLAFEIEREEIDKMYEEYLSTKRSFMNFENDDPDTTNKPRREIRDMTNNHVFNNRFKSFLKTL